MSGDLVERVARAICEELCGKGTWELANEQERARLKHDATAAIRVVVEECARVAAKHEGEWHSDMADGCARAIAAAIRALAKGDGE